MSGGLFWFSGVIGIPLALPQSVTEMPAAMCLTVQALAEVEEGRRTAWVLGHADGNVNHFLL